MASDKVELSSPFPSPPIFYRLYTDENIAAYQEWRQQAAQTDARVFPRPHPLDPDGLLSLDPPPPPGDGQPYRQFGEWKQFQPRITSLREQNIAQLYSDDADKSTELKRLNQSLLVNFLELVWTLIHHPKDFNQKLDHIHLLLININHILNEYRPHQARDTLKLLMEQQIQRRNSTMNEIQLCLQGAGEMIQSTKVACRVGGPPQDKDEDVEMSMAPTLAPTEEEPKTEFHKDERRRQFWLNQQRMMQLYQ
ncbi:MED7 protein-domain-containing protein [Polychytrium aggregatum]|uniref:MED7 protein-domain-containing protein n=1 Tax=Polychytrium aggregatum TaxID=110093 RepID=UPI0022FECC8B|nr:MED7 protein-domain-containing protein [Polychytrium aggregatum]KAI9193749.1 MED7 protein-domain-containing protein [Polychytrium aggregatum]